MATHNADTTRSTYRHELPDTLLSRPGIGSSSAYDPTAFSEDRQTQGAGWPTAATRPTRQTADAVVESAGELVHHLKNADRGDVVFVPGETTIDLTGYHDISVGAPDVTLASDRGPDSEGGLLVINEPIATGKRLLFDVRQPGFRATGLRLVGCQTEHGKWIGYDANQPTTALSLNGDGIEVDNCVIRGWGHAAIDIGRHGYVDKTHVHHCDLVDNPAAALGYGVTVFHGKPLIQYNYFDFNRHSVAGDGYADCSFVVRYNLFGPRTVLHVIDMHSAAEVSGTDVHAGKRISIHHNEILATKNALTGNPQEAIKIRDRPLEGGEIVKNRFHHSRGRFDDTGPGSDGDAIYQTLHDGGQPESFADGGLTVEGNDSDEHEQSETVGIPSSLRDDD